MNYPGLKLGEIVHVQQCNVDIIFGVFSIISTIDSQKNLFQTVKKNFKQFFSSSANQPANNELG